MSVSPSSLPSDGGIGAVGGVGCNAARSPIIIADDGQCGGRMERPLSLTPKVEKGNGRIDSEFTQLQSKTPCSLLVRSNISSNQDQKQQEKESKILDLLREILQVTATNGDRYDQEENMNCSFLSPMIRSSKASVDSTGLNRVSLENDINEEYHNLEGCETTLDASTLAENTTEITPPAAQPMLNQRRRICFDPQAPSVKYTISREDMTHEEKRSFWLQDEEFALIRLRDSYLSNLADQQQRQMAAAAGQSSETLPQSSCIPISSKHWICARGLELKMKFRHLRTQSKRLANLENVLIEQERQWDEHWDEGRNCSPFFYADDAIASVCSEISDDCLVNAQKIAANDRQEVEEFLRAEEQAS